MHIPTQSALFARIVVYIEDNPEEDCVDRDYVVNYSSAITKKWLTRLTVWAMLNNRSITIEKATQEDLATRPLFQPKDQANEVQPS